MRPGGLGATSLEVLMLAENVAVSIRPGGGDIRESPIALALLFFGELLLGRSAFVRFFEPEERLFDPGLADKVPRLGFGKRQDTGNDRQLDRPEMAQGVPDGLCHLGIPSRMT